MTTGLQETFWLYPKKLTYGAWPTSGEIDFAEFYSQYPTLDVPAIHYTEAASGDPNVTSSHCTINQGAFNTYGVDWQPGLLTIYLNGKVCLTDHPNPAAPVSSPAPFNQPFMIALTQALGSGTDAYKAGYHPTSGHHAHQLGAGLESGGLTSALRVGLSRPPPSGWAMRRRISTTDGAGYSVAPGRQPVATFWGPGPSSAQM